MCLTKKTKILLVKQVSSVLLKPHPHNVLVFLRQAVRWRRLKKRWNREEN